jgi:hypothetical protein
VTRTALLLALLFALPARAEIPDAVLILDALSPALPGEIPEAGPPRFVLMKDGQVFLGGTSRIAGGRLEHGEMGEIEKAVGRVRRLPGLGSSVTIGPGTRKQRLLVHEGQHLDIVVTGDPSHAPAGLKPLAALITDLANFDHPSLKPYSPAAYALRVREGTIPGGCRPWGFGFPLAESLGGARSVPAAATVGWPTGASPASVCSQDKSYLVTLRPLLPGERP